MSDTAKEHQAKVAEFLREMSERGFGRMITAPPLYQILWSLGARIPPPHFGPFWRHAWVMGASFGTFMFLVSTPVGLAGSRVSQYGFVGALSLHALVWAVAGLLFGCLTESLYRRSSRACGLGTWEDYRPAQVQDAN